MPKLRHWHIDRGLVFEFKLVECFWLEYCNSDRNSYYANLRRKNGREKPYNVRYSLQSTANFD
jgi:hypothetical protein